ncbi:MAG: flagellar biosynthesis anti-sigma factor FlgM [Phycisphaerales bacterium]|nr:MAG: flagellar biosynthesis anti-sigma factor FlgM [Phycisphaerales bacterium]
MSAIINITSVYGATPSAGTVAGPSTSTPSSRLHVTDVVEFSRFGKALARAVEESSLRIARVRAVREEIASGSFETTERISGTADRLLDVIA